MVQMMDKYISQAEDQRATEHPFWLVNPLLIAAKGITRLWEEKEYTGELLLFRTQSNSRLYYPELLDKAVQQPGSFIRWERLPAPSYAGQLGSTAVRDGLNASNMMVSACIQDRQTVPGPYLEGWFTYHFKDWSALSVLFVEASDSGDDGVALVAIPQGRQDDWLAFEHHLLEVFYGMQSYERKYSIDVLGSPPEGRYDIRREIEDSTFEQVILPPEVIERVMSQCIIFQPEMLKRYESLRVPRLRKVLLIGPPGTGKTTLAKALAAEHRRNGGYVVYVFAGSSEERSWNHLRTALQSAVHSNLPTLIVVEDLENFVARDDNMQAILNTLDGVATPDNKAGTLLLATTNAPEKIDRRITQRPGRIDVMIEISGIKTEEQAIRMLRRFLHTTYCADEHNPIARRLIGQVGSHVREVCLLGSIQAIEQKRDAVVLNDLLWAHGVLLAGRKAAADLDTCEPPKAGTQTMGFREK